MIKIIDCELNTNKEKAFKFPKEINTMSFHYDGGRLSIYVNGKDITPIHTVSKDFFVEINNESYRKQ